jgi:tetratricopeptide (TPR) repeat protein
VRYEVNVGVRDGFKEQKASEEFNRGVALSLEGKEEEALAAFEAALVLEPGHVVATAGKGRALSQLGRTQAALEAFIEASRLDPGDSEHLVQAGLSMLELGLVGRARAALLRASRSDDARHACAARVLDVGRSFMVRAARWRDRGVQKQEAVGYQLGEACFQIALDLWPWSAEAARGLAVAASALEKKDAAIRWTQLAARLTMPN